MLPLLLESVRKHGLLSSPEPDDVHHAQSDIDQKAAQQSAQSVFMPVQCACRTCINVFISLDRDVLGTQAVGRYARFAELYQQHIRWISDTFKRVARSFFAHDVKDLLSNRAQPASHALLEQLIQVWPYVCGQPSRSTTCHVLLKHVCRICCVRVIRAILTTWL